MTPDTGVGPGPAPAGLRRYLPLLLAGIALGAHLAVGAVYALTALIAPGWAVAMLGLWWLALGLAGALLAARRTPAVLAVPVLALASWAVVLVAGDQLLGWRR